MISICVPIYGVEKYIERCAESLFNQSYKDLEYVFVDDCTKDRSIEILYKTIQKYDLDHSRIRIIKHTENRGLAAARNTAVENSSGHFIIHVDPDDFLTNDAIEKLWEKQQRTNADIVVCGFCELRNDGNRVYLPPTSNNTEMYKHNIVCQEVYHNIWGRLIRRDIYIQNNIRVKEGINNGEDLQISPVISYYAKKIAFVPLALYYYEKRNEGSYTNTKSYNIHCQTWESFDIVKSFFADKKEYLDDIKTAEARMIIRDLWLFAKFDKQEYCYTDAIIRLKSIKPLSKLKRLNLIELSILIMTSSKILMKNYIKLLSKLNKIKVAFKSFS